MKKRNSILLLVALSLALFTCRKDVTGLLEIDESIMKVTVLKEGASFAAVRVSIDSNAGEKDYTLQLNGQEIITGQFSGTDTLVFIDSLVPATEYSLRGRYWRKGQLAGISGEEKITTLPLSSNDFTWRVDTVGTFPAQANDLAVIDENNVWAVGYFPRYEGEPSPVSNAVKWNGHGYEYYKIKVPPQGKDTAYVSPLQTVMSFSQNDIWVFHSAGRYAHFNGTSWEPGYIPWASFKGPITKAWGFSSDDLYLIGRNGSITHYDGQSFTLMESGTDADLFDIHGYQDPVTGEKTVWVTCAGWPKGQPNLLKLSNETWIQIWDINNPGFTNYNLPHNIHILDKQFFILSVWGGAANGGIIALFNQDNLRQHLVLTKHYIWDFGISYTSLNNLFITGSWGELQHYDGYNIIMQDEVVHGGRNYEIFTIGSLTFAIGLLNQEALFIHGKQN